MSLVWLNLVSLVNLVWFAKVWSSRFSFGQFRFDFHKQEKKNGVKYRVAAQQKIKGVQLILLSFFFYTFHIQTCELNLFKLFFEQVQLYANIRLLVKNKF